MFCNKRPRLSVVFFLMRNLRDVTMMKHNDENPKVTLHEDTTKYIQAQYLLRAKITGRYLHVTRDLDPGRLLGTVKAQLINAFFVHWICETTLCFAGTIEHVIDRLVSRKCILAGSFDKLMEITYRVYLPKRFIDYDSPYSPFPPTLLPVLIKFVLLNSSKGCSNNRWCLAFNQAVCGGTLSTTRT